MNFLKRIFGKKEPANQEFIQEEHDKNYELKSEGLENVLGKMHNLVGHAIVPFEIGGAVDMYYFPNHTKGTGFVTMELLDPPGNGPLKNRLGTYELIAFTKHDYQNSKNETTPFNLIEHDVCGFFTTIGNYSFQAILNPKETMEVPNGEGEENTCMVLDSYEPQGKKFRIGNREHHLLLCLQVFRNEMEFARENGTDELMKLLKEKGHYPYSDLDGESVA